MKTSPKVKPEFMTWLTLAHATAAIHAWEPAAVSRLHDIWKMGAPSPDSRILLPKGYDERKSQPGNVEKRLVIPSQFTKWVAETAQRRGLNVSEATLKRHMRRKGVQV